MKEDSSLSASFRKASNYFVPSIAVWAAAFLASVLVNKLTMNHFAQNLIHAIGIYLAAVVLLSSFLFAKDWSAYGWLGAKPSRLKCLYVIFAAICVVFATGFLLQALLH